jgi:hypothetical protein
LSGDPSSAPTARQAQLLAAYSSAGKPPDLPRFKGTATFYRRKVRLPFTGNQRIDGLSPTMEA